MSELSGRSGVAIPTIKFYVREGLLAHGVLTSPNQAQYDDSHVERLRLIRALVEVGGLSVASVREVLAAMDRSGPEEVLSATHRAMAERAAVPAGSAAALRGSAAAPAGTAPAPKGGATAAEPSAGESELRAFLEGGGYTIRADNPGIAQAGRVLDAYLALGHDELVELLPEYLIAAIAVAQADRAVLDFVDGRQARVAAGMLGTVLGDALFAGLRQLAQEHVAEQHRRDSRRTPGEGRA
ncbi:MerR family transcriptional regulator [Galbitalea soli]|uniref:MerR family transcriptional regulator n=2 Tax=Galbitalea soli TaxID=1268042 RepID=A0A7C9TRQ2_9MICO|nr:MerR family transcriptional regulator [Galbitalea soli]